MGCHENIKHDKFPKQGSMKGTKAKVCFFYDRFNTVSGEIVRDDEEDPFLTIIKLDDGRYVLGSECQYQPERL